jgi:hypothetical protein
MHGTRAISIAALVCLVGTPALAQVNYPDFSDTSGLTLNGSTAAVTNGIDPAPVLRLARAPVVFDGGSAFTSDRVCLVRFSSFFEFRITNPGGLPDATPQAGADGLTLTLQSAGPTALGGLGGGLGYFGIAPSVAVELDTWNNGPIDAGTNHVGIDINGDVNSVVKAAVPGRFDDGTLWSVWVDYNGTTLEVRVSNTGVRPAAPTVSHVIDIPATLGSDAGFVGFTAATGAAWGDHDVVSWTLDGRCRNVIIEGCDTGVEDFVFPGDGLLSERIRACAIEATTHGEFVSCVAELTNGARNAGFITGRQKGAIQSCAARAPYYTGPVKTAEFIVNGDFETGNTTGWTLTTAGGVWSLNDGTLDPIGPALPLSPIEGLYDLVSHQGGPNLNRAMQKLSVPLDVREATLTWSDRVRSYAAFLDPAQEYRVVIRDAFTLTTLAEVFSTNAGDPPLQEGPNARTFDLTAALQALKGQTVFLSFEQQAEINFFTLTLDDVSLVMTYR